MFHISLVFILCSFSLTAKTFDVSDSIRNSILQKITFQKSSFPYPDHPELLYPYDLKPLNTFTKRELNKVASNVIHCQYFVRKNNGTNPKFRCWLTNSAGQLINGKNEVISDDSSEKIELKVKYRKLNKPDRRKEKDMYTEVFGSLFLRSLGYASDFVIPTHKVVCHGCSKDPFKKTDKREKSRISFYDAIVKMKKKGVAITASGQKGWSFKEVNELIKDHKLPRQKALEFETLAILMNVLVHSSNRSHQQRLWCLGSDLTKPCHKPLGFIHDLGSIMGDQHGFVAFSRSKGHLKKWLKSPIWSDKKSCELNLLFSGQSFIANKISVSEESRLLAINKLKYLLKKSPEETSILETILEISKFHKADHKLRKKMMFQNERKIYHMWLDGFRNKIKELEDVSCPVR